MSKGRSIDGACLRKIAHPTWDEAEAAATNLNQGELRTIVNLLLAYRCHFDATHWHVGHVPWKELRTSFMPGLRRFGAGPC